MIKAPQRFRRPAHTVVDSIDGRVKVSTVHIGNGVFETMVFPLVGDGADTAT